MSVFQMLTAHIASEEAAARTYRYLQSWCGLNGFPGSEAFFLAESKDELTHMQAFQAYVDDLAQPPVNAIMVAAQPSISLKLLGIADCYSQALALERRVLTQLNAIAAEAMKEGNADALRFLQPFTEIGVQSIRDLATRCQQFGLMEFGQQVLLDQELFGEK